MIPATKEVSVLSTISGEQIEVDIDPTKFKYLMSTLTNMYSDIAGAVIREYITNALDSHKDAGQTRPIEVTSPGRLNPNFVVKDYGTGMSLEDIRNTYARYGASTRRDSNTAAGSYGIGSKSGLGFGAGQFTVTAIKDGVKTVCLVGMREDETAAMDIVSSAATDEANGVTISIPVNDNIDSFCSKIHEFHKFVKPGRMLVDGEPAMFSIDMVNENIGIMQHEGPSYTRRHYVVMGDVHYPIDRNLYGQVDSNFDVVFFVGIGEVNITPSREELNYTRFTRERLDGLVQEFQDNIFGHMQKIIQDQPTYREAFNKQIDIRSKLAYNLRDKPFMYDDEELPRANRVLGQQVRWREGVDKYCRTLGEGGMSTIDEKTLYIKDWTNKRFTRVQADKIDKYCENNAMERRSFAVFIYGDINYKLFDSRVTVVSWDEINKIKLPRATTKAGKPARTYLGRGGGQAFGNNIPDPQNNIWYGSKRELCAGYYSKSHQSIAIQYSDDDNEFYFVSDSEKPKFLRTFPNARHYTEFWTDKLDTYLKNLTDRDRKFITLNAGIRNGNLLDSAKIDDPELVEILEFSENKSEDAKKAIQANQDAMGWIDKLSYPLNQKYSEKMPKHDRDASVRLLERYPLLDAGFPWNADLANIRTHLVSYINTTFASL